MTDHVDRAKLVACLRAQNLSYGLSAQRHLSALLDPSTACVVTGQQPAVGGGPFYTLVKISHALAHAHKNNLAPIFWCASEDHDLGEADHADVIDRQARIQRFHHQFAPTHTSLRFRPAHDWWQALWQHTEKHLGQGLGQAFLAQHAPTTDIGMGAWLCQVLNALFTDYGLLCVEGHHLRPLWHNVLAQLMTHWPSAALAKQRQQLLAGGISDAFGDLTEPPLFLDQPSGRTPLSRAAFLALQSDDYNAVSPGAAIRPVVQQAALPAVAYVGGPGELAYHQFIPPIYQAGGVTAPTLIPRCSLSVVPSWISRGVSAWGKTLTDVLNDSAPENPLASPDGLKAYDHALNELARAQHAAPPALARRYAAAIAQLTKGKQRFARSLSRYEQHERGLTPWSTMRDFLLPRQRRQERVMSLFQIIWQFGPGIVHQFVATAARTNPGQHAFIDAATKNDGVTTTA